MNIRYIITLTNAERKHLKQLTCGGKSGARRVKRAQILLAAERGFKDAEIAAMCASSTSTVFRTKRCFVEVVAKAQTIIPPGDLLSLSLWPGFDLRELR